MFGERYPEFRDLGIEIVGISRDAADRQREFAESVNTPNPFVSDEDGAIIERFGLKNPIFSETAAYGHMGRQPYSKEVELNVVEVEENEHEKREIRKKLKKNLEFFTWEKLDHVDQIKEAFNL